MANHPNAIAQAVPTGNTAYGVAVPKNPVVITRVSEKLDISALRPTQAYINRVFDAIEGGPVTWVTLGKSDIASGNSYPGPGTFDPTQSGSDTSNHTIEAIVDRGLFL